MTQQTTLSDESLEVAKRWLSIAGPVPEAEWNFFVRNVRERYFAAGANLIEAGQVCSHLFLVTRGLARYYYITKDGKEFNKSFAMEGGIAASMVCIKSGDASPFYVGALEDCDVLVVPQTVLEEGYRRHPFWERFSRHLVENLAVRKERREAELLMDSAEARYDRFVRNFPDLVARLPLFHIASFLGITPVALSRIRARKASARP